MKTRLIFFALLVCLVVTLPAAAHAVGMIDGHRSVKSSLGMIDGHKPGDSLGMIDGH